MDWIKGKKKYLLFLLFILLLKASYIKANIEITGSTFSGNISAGYSFIPTNLADCKGWWTASDYSTLSFGSGVSVSQWNDKSGNSNHLVQGSGALQPSYNATGLNSLPAIYFDAGEHYMSKTLTSSLSQPLTMFIVVKGDVITGTKVIWDDVGGRLWFSVSGSAWQLRAPTVLTAGTTTDTNPHVITAIYNSASSAIYEDGVSKASGDAGTNGLANFKIGSDKFNDFDFNGKISEIIIYERLLNATEIAKAEAYLTSKWGL